MINQIWKCNAFIRKHDGLGKVKKILSIPHRLSRKIFWSENVAKTLGVCNIRVNTVYIFLSFWTKSSLPLLTFSRLVSLHFSREAFYSSLSYSPNTVPLMCRWRCSIHDSTSSTLNLPVVPRVFKSSCYALLYTSCATLWKLHRKEEWNFARLFACSGIHTFVADRSEALVLFGSVFRGKSNQYLVAETLFFFFFFIWYTA